MVGSESLSSLWSIGFGTRSGRTLVQNDALAQSGNNALIVSVVLANIPQLILSLLYFTYNGLFTCMLLVSEWNSYSIHRKGLRVSSSQREGAQRFRHYPQLPFRFSIPLIMASLLLHWLVSQSIFVVNVSMLDRTGVPIDGSHLVTCGYSPVAIIFTIALGVLLISILLGFGFGARFRTGMPIAGSCSLALAAACDSCDEDSAADADDGGEMLTLTSTGIQSPMSQRPLKWGEIPGYYRDNEVSSTRASVMNGEKSKSVTIVTERSITETATSGRIFNSRRISTTTHRATMYNHDVTTSQDGDDSVAYSEDGSETYNMGTHPLRLLGVRRHDSDRIGENGQDDHVTHSNTGVSALEKAGQSSVR